MLQPALRPQLARIINCRGVHKFPNFETDVRKRKSLLVTNYPGVMFYYHRSIKKFLEMTDDRNKHWFGGGVRSSAMAIQCLSNDKVIAVPTDTIYGFAALAQSNKAIKKLYQIKGREATKPLAICVSSIGEIGKWAEVDHLPRQLIADLLPGPVTIVLKRKKSLNPMLNPGHDTVGIRVPLTKFIRHITYHVGQPLALTSANLSNKPSSLHPKEFSSLWPKLGVIFYEIPRSMNDERRVGSTVVDLTVANEFEIIRAGVRFEKDLAILQRYGRRRYPTEKNDEPANLEETKVALSNS